MRVFLCAIFLLAQTHLGLAQEGTFRSLQHSETQSGERNTLERQSFLAKDGLFIQTIRGVVMQAFAEFETPSGDTVGSAEVEFGSALDRYCIRIGESDCAPISFSRDEIKAMKQVVERAGTAVFTLPSDGPDDDQESIQSNAKELGMKPSSFDPQDWIAAELDNSTFHAILAYVDYSGSFVDRNRAGGFTEEAARNMREAADVEGKSGVTRLDGTYFNGDFDANYLVAVEGGSLRCTGLPARYNWTMYDNLDHVVVTSVDFARDPSQFPDYVKEEAPHLLRLQSQALEMFCVMAVLRRLHLDDALSLP